MMRIKSLAKRTSKGDRQITINIQAKDRLDLPRETPLVVAGRVIDGPEFTYTGYYTFSERTNQNHRLYGGAPPELTELIPFGRYGDKHKILVELFDLKVRNDDRKLILEAPAPKVGPRLFDQALVLQRWVEQGRKCAYCKRTTQEHYIEGDHRIAVANGGPTEPWSCVAACRECNRQKKTMSAEDFAWEKSLEQVFRQSRR